MKGMNMFSTVVSGRIDGKCCSFHVSQVSFLKGVKVVAPCLCNIKRGGGGVPCGFSKQTTSATCLQATTDTEARVSLWLI